MTLLRLQIHIWAFQMTKPSKQYREVYSTSRISHCNTQFQMVFTESFGCRKVRTRSIMAYLCFLLEFVLEDVKPFHKLNAIVVFTFHKCLKP